MNLPRAIARLAFLAIPLLLSSTSALADKMVDVQWFPVPQSASPGKDDVASALLNKESAIIKSSEYGVTHKGCRLKFRAEKLLDTPYLYSVVGRGRMTCPGDKGEDESAHAYTFDMQQVKTYDPTELYAIAVDAPENKDKKARGKIILPAVKQQIKARLLNDKAGCTQAVVTKEFDHAWTTLGLSTKGLTVFFVGGEAGTTCLHDTVLPYSSIQQYLNKHEATRLHWQY